MAATDIATLAEIRSMLGYDVTNTRDDAKILALISPVSDAIRSYTERDFGFPVVTEERLFDYDGSGFLDIDDATAITSVTMTFPYGAPDIALDADSWEPAPSRRDDAPIFTYIKMPDLVGGIANPAMGFRWNADVYAADHPAGFISQKVKVTGTWGWASTPSDVKLAATWLMKSWLTRPLSDGLSSESIEGWARSWGSRGGASAASLAIPDPVRDLLSGYTKIEV